MLSVSLRLSLCLCLAALATAAPNAPVEFERRSHGHATSDGSLYDHLGNLSPYHHAAIPSGIKSQLPADCKVDQVMLMGRHGSRYPLTNELPFITGLVTKLGKSAKALAKTKLPEHLAFLKKGYTSTLGTNDLTAPGRKQLFQHGVSFKLRYPDLPATGVLAGGQDRVVESAQWFANGYFGRQWANLSETAFSTLPENNVTVSWITPMDTCAKWDYNYGNNATVKWGKVYLPPITKRLNKALPDVHLTDDDTHGALYACAYDYAAHGLSPWCGAFTKSEIADFEYELDLLMSGAFGYGLPGDMGPLLGTLYVNKLIERFTNASGAAQPVYLEFGHDTTIDQALTALGLARDAHALSPAVTQPPQDRRWRTSQQVPFGAQMVWERFQCTKSFDGPQIRLVLNDAPLSLGKCTTRASAAYGSCALDAFVKANAFSTGVKWGDSHWNATCGNAGF